MFRLDSIYCCCYWSASRYFFISYLSTRYLDRHHACFVFVVDGAALPFASPDRRMHVSSVASQHRSPHRARVAAHPQQGLEAGAQHQHRSVCPPADVHRADRARPSKRGGSGGPEEQPRTLSRAGGVEEREGFLDFFFFSRCFGFIGKETVHTIRHEKRWFLP